MMKSLTQKTRDLGGLPTVLGAAMYAIMQHRVDEQEVCEAAMDVVSTFERKTPGLSGWIGLYLMLLNGTTLLEDLKMRISMPEFAQYKAYFRRFLQLAEAYLEEATHGKVSA